MANTKNVVIEEMGSSGLFIHNPHSGYFFTGIYVNCGLEVFQLVAHDGKPAFVINPETLSAGAENRLSIADFFRQMEEDDRMSSLDPEVKSVLETIQARATSLSLPARKTAEAEANPADAAEAPEGAIIQFVRRAKTRGRPPTSPGGGNRGA